MLTAADGIFRGTLQQAFGDHLTEGEVTKLRGLLRKLLECNGAWQDARCAPL